jgi:hypothetical protein
MSVTWDRRDVVFIVQGRILKCPAHGSATGSFVGGYQGGITIRRPQWSQDRFNEQMEDPKLVDAKFWVVGGDRGDRALKTSRAKIKLYENVHTD